MSSLFSALNIAGEGLSAQTLGLVVTGQNVSNVNTPGYVRRTLDLTTLPADGGVTAAAVLRVPASFAEAQVVAEDGKQNAAAARSSALGDVESLLAPSGGSTIADQSSAFFSSMTALSQSPSDPSARSAVLSAADQLARSISGAANGLDQIRQGLLTQAQGAASDVNQRLQAIAKLNARIASATAAGGTPSDLMDQRDALVDEVGQRIDVQAVSQPSGAVTLLSSGAALVDGSNASTVDVGTSSTGDLAISVSSKGGSVDVTSGVTSGTLGGLREARDVDVPKVAGQLDQYAYDLSNDVNALHASGYGLDGKTGRPLFQPSAAVAGAARAMAVSSLVAGNPNAIAATSSAGALPGGNDLALSIAGLASQPQGTSASPAQAFGLVTSTVGTAKQDADAEVTLRTGTLAQAQNLRDSADGVSIQEETVNLTRYQDAFQASQQVLQTVDSLLDGFLKAV